MKLRELDGVSRDEGTTLHEAQAVDDFELTAQCMELTPLAARYRPPAAQSCGIPSEIVNSRCG